MTSFNENKVEFVLNTLIGSMEQGTIPWILPYNDVASVARSFTTKKPYSISNQMYLFVQQLNNEGEYIGQKAVENDKNLSLKEGARPLKIFFALPPMYRETKTPTGEKQQQWYGGFTKVHIVYNVKDVNGINDEFKSSSNFEYLNADDVIKKYIGKTGIKISIENVTPAYNQSDDTISIPNKEQFVNETEYYKTIFHEIIHSTITKERCNRKGIFLKRDEQDEYAAEELVAEIGAAYLAALCNLPDYINTIPNAAAYCQGWYNKLKGTPSLLLKASNAAEKAVRYILEHD